MYMALAIADPEVEVIVGGAGRGVREGAEMNETEMPALWNTVFYAEKGRNFNNIKRKKSQRN